MIGKFLDAALAACLGLALVAPAGAQQSFSPSQRTEIEKIVHEYLLANPNVLAEVAQEMERRQQAEEKIAQARRIQENKGLLLASATDYVHNPDGAVPVVEFFDYQCGYCKRVLPAMQKLRAEGKDVRIIYKEYPILGPVSTFAARAAIASRAQGKYIAFHDAMMSNRSRLSERSIRDLAGKTGLDVAQLQKDMASAEVQAVLDQNLQLGQSLQVRGTPAMFIGDTYVPGAVSYDQMVALVAQARENCAIC